MWQKKGGEIIKFKRRKDHALDDDSLRLEHMKKGTKPKAKTPTTPDKSTRVYDKICYIKVGEDRHRNLFVIEYKAAHKLTPALVQEGMRDLLINMF